MTTLKTIASKIIKDVHGFNTPSASGFPGRQPTAGDQHQSKVTANLQMQVSEASPFSSHRSRAAGDKGSSRWRCRLPSAQALQGGSGTAGFKFGKETVGEKGHEQFQNQAGMPAFAVTPPSHHSVLPGVLVQGSLLAQGAAQHPAFARVPCRSKWLPLPPPPWDRGACTPGSCRCCSRAQR